VDRATRSRMMSSIRGRDTRPERMVRSALWRRGLRFRLHVGALPGRPDIVLPKWHTVVQVQGCFWHGHSGCRYFKLPGTRREFWEGKITSNQVRDRRVLADLNRLGWRCIVVWECALRDDPEQALRLVGSAVVRGSANVEITSDRGAARATRF
jgi:DNA mismatch endonuclease (patch repair protein)